MMSNPVQRMNVVMKTMEGSMNLGRLDQIIHRAQVLSSDAIPIEQLKGDIARAGHPIKQALALDADSRRLFFTDVKGEHLYAEFATASEGHRITHIGHQASLLKEMVDVTDLEPSGKMEVVTAHEEEDEYEEPGVYPPATAGDKPEENDRGFGKDSNTDTVRKALLAEMGN